MRLRTWRLSLSRRKQVSPPASPLTCQVAAPPAKSSRQNESKSISRRFPALARGAGFGELLRAVSRREKMVMGDLLARWRIFFMDYLPMGVRVFSDERFGRGVAAANCGHNL